MTASIPQPTRRTLLGRMQSLDLALLIGIVAVVVIVSLPRLSAFARRENEADARRMVRRLAQLFDDDALAAAPPSDTQALFERLPRSARRQFEDQVIVDDGRILLRHGYYFEFLRVPSFTGDTRGILTMRAWPARPSEVALPSFLGFSGAHVLRNAALVPPPSGPDAGPTIGSPLLSDLRARGWELVAAPDAE